MALLQLDDLMTAPARPRRKTVDVTPNAVQRVQQILDSRPEKAGQGLRLYVANGGCAGYSYGMDFDMPGDNDTIVDCNGLKVMIDGDSLQWLQGVQVDYTEAMVGSGFSITNPNAKAGCGCGSSFSKGDGSAPADTGSCKS